MRKAARSDKSNSAMPRLDSAFGLGQTLPIEAESISKLHYPSPLSSLKRPDNVGSCEAAKIPKLPECSNEDASSLE